MTLRAVHCGAVSRRPRPGGGRDCFSWAQSDALEVTAPGVPRPVALRYGWATNPDCNLVNSRGLPASPFRTDDHPRTTRSRLRPV